MKRRLAFFLLILLGPLGKASVDWKRGPQPAAAGVVASSEALVGVIEELMNTVSVYIASQVRACVALLALSADRVRSVFYCVTSSMSKV